MLAFVISKLDQNNGLLAGYPKHLIGKLQSVQNAAAKLIYGYKRYDHVEVPLQELHWLPIEYPIKYKILMICYKCLNGNGSDYLKELLVPYRPTRSLRSCSANLLAVPRTAQKTCGDRSFGVMGPQLWNALPAHVKDCDTLGSFKKQLKTYFFKDAFNV